MSLVRFLLLLLVLAAAAASLPSASRTKGKRLHEKA